MLSYTRGDPIAIIKGGSKDGEIIHLYDGKEKGKKKKKIKYEEMMPDIEIEDPFDIISEKYLRGQKKRMNVVELEKLKKALMKDIEPLDEDLADIFTESKKVINDIAKKEIKLNEGEIIPIPETKTRDVLYIAGPSGSGKSTYAAAYIKQYQKLFPDNEVYIFSRVEEDKVLDKLNPTRFLIDEDMVENPIDPKELADSLVLFDDIDTITDKKLNEAVRKLRDDILETGRHNNIYVVCTSHQLMNYKHTRTLLNEATLVTFFPQSGSSYHIKRFLKEYAGLDRKTSSKILALPSRWVTIHKSYPLYVLYSKGVFLL